MEKESFIFYPLEELLSIKEKCGSRHSEQIKKSKGLTDLFLSEDTPTYTNFKKGKAKLSIGKDNGFIRSSVIDKAGKNKEENTKREFTKNLNFLTRKNFNSIFETLSSQLDSNMDVIVDALIKKLTAPNENPESPSGSNDILAFLIKKLADINEDFFNQIHIRIDESFESLLQKPQEKRQLLNLLVCISYFFRCNFIKRCDYGYYLKALINSEQLSLPDRVEILIITLTITCNFIDHFGYVEYCYFYRYLDKLLPQLKGYLQCKYQDLQEQREKEFKSSHVSFSQQQQTPPKSPSKSSLSSIKRSPSLEDVFTDFRENQKFNLPNLQNPSEFIHDAINKVEHYHKTPLEYYLFIAKCFEKYFGNNKQLLINELIKSLPIIKTVVEDSEKPKIWDILIIILNYLLDNNALTQQEALEISSNSIIKQDISNHIKLYLIDNTDSLIEYEKSKIDTNDTDRFNQMLATIVAYDPANIFISILEEEDDIEPGEKLNLYWESSDKDIKSAFIFMKNLVLYLLENHGNFRNVQHFNNTFIFISANFPKDQITFIVNEAIKLSKVPQEVKGRFKADFENSYMGSN